MPTLVVLSDEMKGYTFELTADKITVGRVADNMIYIEHSAVSSHHAELTRKGDDYIVRDLNSTNGTRVNGQRILESRLTHQDMIQFGSLELQYLSSANAAPQPRPAPLKKTVDLSAVPRESSIRPITYSSSSPFKSAKRGKSKTYLQYALVVLGITAIILLAVIVIRILKTKL